METVALTLQKLLTDPSLSPSERALLRCGIAKELEEAGNYEAARNALGDLWREGQEKPDTTGLDDEATAELILRAGTIRGWLATRNPTENGQERAKNLLTDALDRYRRLDNRIKVCETFTNLAFCYWRNASYDEARITFAEALRQLGDPTTPEEKEQKANTLMSAAIVELSATRLVSALRLMDEAEPFVAESTRDILRGRFHANRGIILKNLSAEDPNQEEYADRALQDFTAAICHFEQSSHVRFRANTENNLGSLFYMLRRYAEAEEHLDRARSLFSDLKDKTNIAQVNETRARVLLALKRNADAEKLIGPAVRTLERTDQHGWLAGALITQGVAQARLHKAAAARASFERALETADLAGAVELAGLAALTCLEELGHALTANESADLYRLALPNLVGSQSREVLVRLAQTAGPLITGAVAAPRAARPGARPSHPTFVHADPATSRLLARARLVAAGSGPVLITGETGTGKDLLARLIHEWSGRPGHLVAINCAALATNLFESHLFGHRKGSFTDATADQPGAARHSAGGTLFLDEIADVGLPNQSKLLRLIENNEVQTVGAPSPEILDLRVIAATNQSLDPLVAAGQFRQDLRFRLAGVEIYLPPLRERRDDIPPLAEYFVAQANVEHGRQTALTPDAVDYLRGLPLHGNARELRAIIDRAFTNAAGTDAPLTAEDLRLSLVNRSPQPHQLQLAPQTWDDFDFQSAIVASENQILVRALNDSNGSVTKAAQLLGIPRQTLIQRLETRNKDAAHARKGVVRRGRSRVPARRKSALRPRAS